MYVNLGFGTDGPDGGPPNMSFPMVSPFQILGPSKNPYPGTVCLPEVPLPANTTVQPGDNATIQVVEIAVHGAALFSVSLWPLRKPPPPFSFDDVLRVVGLFMLTICSSVCLASSAST